MYGGDYATSIDDGEFAGGCPEHCSRFLRAAVCAIGKATDKRLGKTMPTAASMSEIEINYPVPPGLRL